VRGGPGAARGSIAALLLLCAAVPVQARSIEIDDFSAVIEVRADGVIRVEERIEVDFRGAWNGIVRDVPYGYTHPSGVRGQIRLAVTGVEDAEGQALEHWQGRSRGNLELKIRVPGARDARRTIVIRYDAENVIRRVESPDVGYGLHDELYWNVTGHGWQVPIRRAAVELRLPQGVSAEEVRFAAYTGQFGSREADCQPLRSTDSVLACVTTRPLAPHAGLTVAVGFPSGRIRYPSLARRLGWLLAANWPVSLPVGCVLLAWLLWWKRGRDPVSDRTIVPEWEPPLGLRPSEIGVLIDDSMDQRDLTASIFDLAVRGVLTIRESGDQTPQNRDFVLSLNEQALDGAKLETFEEALIDGLFGGKSEVALDSLSRKFFEKVGRVNDKVLDDLVVKGLFRARPDKVRARSLLLALGVLAGMVGAGAALSAPSSYWIAAGLALPALVVFAWNMPRKTKAGIDALARVKGMEQYLLVAEKERLERLPLQQIERLLPYAIALDLHDRWTTLFAGLFERPPDWYRARGDGWVPHSMGGIIGDMGRSVKNNLYSVPRTESSARRGWGGGYSGGSGFSGGGRAGGGFGGGGGRGW